MEDVEHKVLLLSKEEASEKDQFLDNFDSQGHNYPLSPRKRLRELILTRGPTLVAALSILTNIIFLLFFLTSPYQTRFGDDSPIVGLHRNAITKKTGIATDYSINTTLRDQKWADIKYDRGAVILDEKTVSQNKMENTLIFPWDSTKRVYIVKAYHQLHCLKLLYQTLTQVEHGSELIGYEHLVHCLDQLRQDVVCAADDDLSYIGDTNSGHFRQCRDFSKLDKWALDHHACYTFEKPPKPGFQLDRFANCRESSPYLQKMRDHFGFDNNWVPEYPPHEGLTFPDW